MLENFAAHLATYFIVFNIGTYVCAATCRPIDSLAHALHTAYDPFIMNHYKWQNIIHNTE